MLGIGPGELIIILVVALLVLGPKRLPDVANGLGKAIREFRKAARDIQNQIEADETVSKPLAELQSALRYPFSSPPPAPPSVSPVPAPTPAPLPVAGTPPSPPAVSPVPAPLPVAGVPPIMTAGAASGRLESAAAPEAPPPSIAPASPVTVVAAVVPPSPSKA